MGASQSDTRDYSGDMAGNEGNIHNNTGILSGNSGSVTGVTIGRSFARPRSAPTPSTFTVANATSGSVSLFYKKEKLNTSDLILGTSLVRSEGVGSVVIEPGQHIQCPVFTDLYVTAFQVTLNQPFDCPSGKPMFENLLAEYASGENKSCIITASGEVKMSKEGEIWVDQSGQDLKPEA